MTLADISDTQIQLSGGWIPGNLDSSYFPISGDHVDAHQQEMYKALADEKSCILNSNPTGAGKTLSWAAPVIRRDSSTPDLVLVTYPTAALLEDQRETLIKYLRQYFSSDREPWVSETGYKLVSGSEESPGRISDGGGVFQLTDLVLTVSATADPHTPTDKQIKTAINKAIAANTADLPAIILTTPDTLTLLATNRFHDRDVNRLIPTVDAIIIDEFHLATDRARRLLPFHLDHYRTLSGRYLKSFVFLSATPHPSYVDRLERAYDVTTVTDNIVSEQSRTTAPSTRQILPTTTLGVTTRPRFTNGRWLVENVDQLAAAHQPPGQLLVIVDSVREVEQVAEAVAQETDLSVGRVYGWKRKERQAAIRRSDVIVGNTAVEVGVDFDSVNRLVCTGYEPASTLQRIGRMRQRSKFDDYRALLITNGTIQTALVTEATHQELNRVAFDRALHIAEHTVEQPYYDVLCGAYTWYLWNDASRPLKDMYVDGQESFIAVAANHFKDDFQYFFGDSQSESFWDRARTVVQLESLPEAVFEELHTYRSSSLSCLVLDTQDPGERIKRYNLSHVLRHRKGELISLDEVTDQFEQRFGRSPRADEQATIDQAAKYAVVGFVSMGSRETTRDYYLQDFGTLRWIKQQIHEVGPQRGLATLSHPRIDTNPSVEGLDKVNLDTETILVQYVDQKPKDARQRFGLGPYAAIVPTAEGGSFLLWDDAIKAHAHLVSATVS